MQTTRYVGSHPATRCLIQSGGLVPKHASLAAAHPKDALPIHTITLANGRSGTNRLASQQSAATPFSISMTNGQCGTLLPSHEMHNAGSRSLVPASSQPRHVSASLTKAAPAVRTFFDPWNSSSTGHQRAENRLSGSTSWRASRNLKLSEQYKGGLGGGGRRVADTVGAGSEDFGKDGRKENGGWEKGAKGLRTGGQRSLAEVWGASKSGLKQLQEKDSELVVQGADHGSTSGHSDNDEGMSTRATVL